MKICNFNNWIIIIIMIKISKIEAIFSDAYIDMRFLLKSPKECIFFEIHQPHSQMDISVSTLKSEYPLSVELLSPSEISLKKTENSGRHYFKFPEKDGLTHEIGDFQLCVSTSSRQIVQISLIIVIYEKNANNIDVASNLKRIKTSSSDAFDATRLTLEKFEKITLNIDEKLKIIKTEQAKRAFVEQIDRSHIETAFEMINFWHILRVFAVFFIAGFQVHAIRSLLSVKR